jgi:Glycosyltransferase like family
MKLSIVTAVCGANEITLQWLQETINNCAVAPEVIIIANGCTVEEVEEIRAAMRASRHFNGNEETGRRFDISSYPDPIGSTKAFNIASRIVEWGNIIAMLHNDLMIREPGWDTRLLEFFVTHSNAGVVGFHGAQGLGAIDIYRSPYRLEQLARWNCWSNLEDWAIHGKHAEKPLPVAVVDGMAICVRKTDIKMWGGLDESLGLHHMYDNDICLTALMDGKMNYVLPIRARHLSGQTANFPRYNKIVADIGGDAGVHRIAHERFYKKWQGRLPVFVPQNQEDQVWWSRNRPQ